MIAPVHRVESEDECDCEECQCGTLEELERESFTKYGWYIHFVHETVEDVMCLVSEEDVNTNSVGPMGANYHTHGLPNRFGHPDIQIVWPMKPETAHGLFHCAVKVIEKNGPLVPFEPIEGICGGGYAPIFVPAWECDTPQCTRQVLRMILPDVDGNLTPGEELKDGMHHQYCDLLDEHRELVDRNADITTYSMWSCNDRYIFLGYEQAVTDGLLQKDWA